MKKVQVGKTYHLRKRFDHRIIGCQVLATKWTPFGQRALVWWYVHDLDFDYTFKKNKWVFSRRLM